MKRYKKPYCASNGCFMIVMTSAIPCPIKCKNCNNEYNTSLNLPVFKLCPKCGYCPECNRIGKKHYMEMNIVEKDI
jgi:hypothetical protein